MPLGLPVHAVLLEEILGGGGQATAISAGPTADSPALEQPAQVCHNSSNDDVAEAEVLTDDEIAEVFDVDPVTGIVDAEIIHDSWATVAEAVRESGLQRSELEKREDGRWHPKTT